MIRNVIHSLRQLPPKGPLFSLLLFTGISLLLYWLLDGEGDQRAFLLASGRMEGRETHLTAKLPATVRTIHVDEGDAVQKGQLLAELEDEALLARLSGAREGLLSLQASVESSRIALETEQQELPIKIEQARAGLANARSRLQQAKTRLAQAQRDAKRLKSLATENLTSRQAAESAQLQVDLARVDVQAAESAQVIAEKTLELSELGTQRLLAQRSAHQALVSQLRQTRTTVTELQSRADDLGIEAPVSGTILTRSIETGEQVTAGSPLFSLVDLNRLYLKIYVPEPSIGLIRLQQEGRIYLDAYPGQSFPAQVSKIAQQAEFTPKQVETREERVNLVFAVELRLEANPGGVFKPGMPADALLRTDEGNAEWPANIN